MRGYRKLLEAKWPRSSKTIQYKVPERTITNPKSSVGHGELLLLLPQPRQDPKHFLLGGFFKDIDIIVHIQTHFKTAWPNLVGLGSAQIQDNGPGKRGVRWGES